MDFRKRHNAFCDIPGFAASKGEPGIVEALQKLWQKIEYLEQIRLSERKSELSRNAKVEQNEDLTITEVQYKLLVLQLQYARSLLRKKHDRENSFFHSEIKGSEKEENLIMFDRNYPKATNQDFMSVPVSQETQTSNYFDDDLNPSKKSDFQGSVIKANVPVSSESQFLKSKHSPEKIAPLRTFPNSSKPHYHLKLDDVPFILGASSTASHSVVANVQNIIAMMKSHNKALCGPKHPNKSAVINTQSTHSPEADSSEGNSNDVTKMVNELSRDLAVLASKQQKLMKSIDAAQVEKGDSRVNLIRNFQDRGNKIKDKSVDNPGLRRRHRSNSESEVKFYADVKNVPRFKGKDAVKGSTQQKEIISNMRSHPSNFSIMDRRKLLRSLHNFKTHLSQEDISWD